MASMLQEHQRRERFIGYVATLRERFGSGLLAQLQPLQQWVVWKPEQDMSGHLHKVPYNARSHFKASSKKPQTWESLETAIDALATGRYAGIGFMVTPPFILVDLDHSYDRPTRTITNPTAQEIIMALDSFTEASPRAGLHVLLEATMPGKNLHAESIEIYTNWFSTITTDHIPGTPITIHRRQEALDALYKQYSPPVAERPFQNTSGGVGSGAALTELPPEAANDTLLQQLLRGDITGFASASNADFVLVLKLLHWTGDNVALTRRLFVQSGLYRAEKTERRIGSTTYLDMTIWNALRKRRNPPMRR